MVTLNQYRGVDYEPIALALRLFDPVRIGTFVKQESGNNMSGVNTSRSIKTASVELAERSHNLFRGIHWPDGGDGTHR
jgi:hypothetical protein